MLSLSLLTRAAVSGAYVEKDSISVSDFLGLNSLDKEFEPLLISHLCAD